MKNLLSACLFLFFSQPSFSQPTTIRAEKYPSLLWEITGKKLSKPSYLFGTMHVSSKMAFHLSDSFYLGIRSAQIVALETNPGTWQEDFSRYDLDGEGMSDGYGRSLQNGRYDSSPQDYLTIHTLKQTAFEKSLEAALYSNPTMLNSFLYRSNSVSGSDFEEDTYLDLHIFQTGRKLGKIICGVEDFHSSMQLVKEAYRDAAKEKKKKGGYDYDDDLSYARLEEAYRTGNLDLLDTINKVNSQSAAFDEKFLYQRNDIQAASIDSILKTGASLFVGVGAAHLPGERGVIEILRRQGYRLRAIKMKERDSRHKENIEKIRVPVQFSRQVSKDGFWSVMAPGQLYSFGKAYGNIETKQYADMTNGSYYMVTRIFTRAGIQGQTDRQVHRKLDSVLYENIPGKVLVKRPIVKNGYHGYDITNRTRRGDIQRYNIFVTPLQILIFKISGNGDYVRQGTEAEQFFSSILLKEAKTEWKKWSPSYGGFEVELPHQPFVFQNDNRVYTAYEPVSKTTFEIVRSDIHHYDFLEEDTFDLSLMEESFASSDAVARLVSRQWLNIAGYPALDARYQFKDSSIAAVRYLIKGPHYYTLVATAKAENRWIAQFFRSFVIMPFQYPEAKLVTDTMLHFRVLSPVALQKTEKLSMYPDDLYYGSVGENADDSLIDNGIYKSKVILNDSTGEKIHVCYFKHSPYFFSHTSDAESDSSELKKNWVVRRKTESTTVGGLQVTDYLLGHKNSSRMLRVKTFLKQGMGYTLETSLDTVSNSSAFIHTFFESFEPLDLLQDADIKSKKTGLFFSQYFSSDTMLHKKAVKNIGMVEMDSTDFLPLQRSIGFLTWKEKAYLQVKKELIYKLADMPTVKATEYLSSLYYRAGDTAELQYAALETLLAQKTALSYRTFTDILENDPPVLDIDINGSDVSVSVEQFRSNKKKGSSGVPQSGSFLHHLRDSLPLTAGIMKRLLPLMDVDDYEQPVMELLGMLVDSNLVRPQDYETYVHKFVLKAKQLLKKQLIQEKASAIKKARTTEEERSHYDVNAGDNTDNGNNRLSQYATLLLPFREKHTSIEQIFQRLLQSHDKRLRYKTALLLWRNNHSVSDSIIHFFAALDEFRYELYTDLKKLKKENLFPDAYRSQELMARSRLMSLPSFAKPDSLVLLQKLPLHFREHEGYVYVFKYKEKKEDNTWKIATSGLYSLDSSQLLYAPKNNNTYDDENDFTQFTATKLSSSITESEQLEKLRKKLLYSRRKSAARFYEEANRYSDFEFSGIQ